MRSIYFYINQGTIQHGIKNAPHVVTESQLDKANNATQCHSVLT